MALIKFSKITTKYKDYKQYRIWLEENSYPKFCGYSWLIIQTSLSIDHYKPKEHFPELKANPNNLIPCTTDCNSSKGDYHPEAKDRRYYKEDSFNIFNYRQEDIGKHIKIESDGQLSCISHFNKSRFDFNEKVFKYNRYHNRETRKEYLDLLNGLIEIYNFIQESNNTQLIEEWNKKLELFKEVCSKRLIFYKLFNIKIPKHIEKLLTNRTKAEFIR